MHTVKVQEQEHVTFVPKVSNANALKIGAALTVIALLGAIAALWVNAGSLGKGLTNGWNGLTKGVNDLIQDPVKLALAVVITAVVIYALNKRRCSVNKQNKIIDSTNETLRQKAETEAKDKQQASTDLWNIVGPSPVAVSIVLPPKGPIHFKPLPDERTLNAKVLAADPDAPPFGSIVPEGYTLPEIVVPPLPKKPLPFYQLRWAPESPRSPREAFDAGEKLKALRVLAEGSD